MSNSLFQLFLAAIFMCGLPLQAYAAQSQTLTGTAHYKVTYDARAVQETSFGKFEILLHFFPRGDQERKAAVAEYKENRYRSHLESYEIDCTEQTAFLNRINILDKSAQHLKQLPAGTQAEPIPPGSILDKVAEHICPVPEEYGDEPVEPAAVEQDATDVSTLSSDQQHQIDVLKEKAATKGATGETWKELGDLYFDTDQPDPAINAYEQALRFKPDDIDILNDQGAMYRQKGNFKQALVNFERVISLDPNNLESLYNTGYVYAFDMKDIPKSLIMWQRYLKLEPQGETAKQLRQLIEQYTK